MSSLYVIFILLTLLIGIAVVVYLVKYKYATEGVDISPEIRIKERMRHFYEEVIYDEIVVRDAITKDIMLDLRLFEAYYSDHKLDYLIIFTMAYILKNKMHHKTTFEYVGVLRRFSIAPNCRNEDLCPIILNTVREPNRKLISTLIEKQLARCIKLNHRDYENMMINVVLKLSRIKDEITNEQ